VFRLRSTLLVLLPAAAMLAGPAAGLPACDVPVYRYALERWEPGVYDLVVFEGGRLDDGQAQALDALRKAAADVGGHANLRVVVAHTDADMPERLRRLWDDQQPADVPWSGRLSPEGAEAVLRSPARREIARRIADGQTGVWVLVESGDAARDDAAARVIAAELGRMPQELTLPTEIAEQAPHLAAHLRIEFSLLRLSRSDSAEAVLAAMLLRSEADLLTVYADEPVAFPVFGRGRTLFAVVGDGIIPGNVLMGCRFLVGRCSCEIKDQNPGIDLLVDYPWQRDIGVSLVDLVELPPPIEQSQPVDVLAKSNPPAAPPRDGGRSGLLRNTVVVLVFIVLGAALLALLVIKHSRQESG